MENNRESLSEKYSREADDLLTKLDKETNPALRKSMVGFALACAGFEGAFGVWDEQVKKMKRLLDVKG